MTEELHTTVVGRLSQDGDLEEEAKYLVLAALEGPNALADLLDTGQPPAVFSGETAIPVAPARAYLSAITVSGFRGIGPASTLKLAPGPGLIVVSGRNGSGKSSFAEAAEVALTRKSYRWDNRPSTLMKRWRNLRDDPPEIRVDLVEERSGTTAVEASWADEAGFEDIQSWVQRQGEKRVAGVESLGWTTDMDLFRPFLFHSELENLFSTGGKLHEALNSILGLDRLNATADLLRSTLRAHSADKERADAARKQLRADLADVDDERARLALAELRRRPPDLDTVASLAAGDNPGFGESALRSVSELQILPVETFMQRVRRVREAKEALISATNRQEMGDARRLSLLESALRLHDDHGDQSCPVCGEGQLDGAWAAQARDAVQDGNQAIADVQQAENVLGQATRALRANQPAPSALLVEAAEAGLVGATSLEQLWARWYDLDDDTLLSDGVALLGEVTALLGEVVAEARKEADRRQDAWRPHALALAEWCRLEKTARVKDEMRRHLEKASDWMRQHLEGLRKERMRPLADRARHVWSLLRQESNVDLGEITLTGVGNRKSVTIDAAVDGDDTVALDVMSQGELNALTLALFIPKATLPESPFGFLVIDDPVQAMDPSKVDGLARVLEETAENRQVVVLTHDDRLPEAVRRLNIQARLVEVSRAVDSVVTVVETSDPARRYLADAEAVALTSGLAGTIQGRAVAEMCRMSVEAKCRDIFFVAQLRQGKPRADVESAWNAIQGTRPKVAAVVRGDARADLRGWQDQGRHRHRKLALDISSSVPHHGQNTNLKDAIRAVERLLEDLTVVGGGANAH